MNNLEHLAELINSFPADIKAEVLMAELVEHGYSPFDFVIFLESQFKRRYSKDILEAGMVNINDYEKILAIYLARDGLYDLLPEGLFHDSSQSALKSGNDMALDSRKEAHVEMEARKFFRPLENEFFYHRVLIEMEERAILKKFHDASLDDFFQRFWKCDQSLPGELTLRLVSYLPFVKDIVGDFKLTANCLGSILNETVDCNISYTTQITDNGKKEKEETSLALGQASLGTNLIAGGEEMECHKLIRFTIGPLKNTNVEAYLDGGTIARFIEYFTGYFLPLEVDVSFDIETGSKPDGFSLAPGSGQPIMGYDTVI